jgi:hypothetical protein
MIAPVAVSDVSGREWASLMWGFFWRGIVFTIGCAFGGAIAGGICGAIIGVVMGVAGFPLQRITSVTQSVGFVLGLVVGILGLRVYITWLLQSRFGPFRLVLIRRDGVQPSGTGHSVTVGTA